MHLTIQQKLQRSLALATMLGLLAMSSFMVLEPAVSSAQTTTDSDTVNVNQTVQTDISITAGADISLATIDTTNNSAVGQTTLTVKTNNDAGYSLTVADDSNEAFQSGGADEFTDFNDGLDDQIPWSVTNDYQFGFSAYGAQVGDNYDNGNVTECAPSGTDQDPNTSALNWQGFDGSGFQIEIASSTAISDFNGDVATLCVASEQSGVFAPAGSYSTTITATATTN